MADLKSLLALLGAAGIALVTLIGLWVGDRRFILAEGHSVIAPMTSLIIVSLSLELLLLRWGPRRDLVRLQAWWVCGLLALVMMLELILRLGASADVLPWDRWMVPEFAGARGMQPTPMAAATTLALLLSLASLSPLLLGARCPPGIQRLAQAANAAAIGVSIFHLFCSLLGISPLVIGVLLTGAPPVHCALLLLALAIAGSNNLWSTTRTLLFGTEAGPEGPPGQEELRRENRVLAGLLAISIATLLTLALALRADYRKCTEEVDRDLRAIANLKASETATWIHERIMDARWHALSPHVRSLVDGPPLQHAIMEELSQSAEYFRETYGYTAVLICDVSGRVCLSTPADLPTENLVTPELLASAREGLRPRLLDFYSVRNRSFLASTAPIPGMEGNPPRGFVLLIIDPRKVLIPMLERWPSGESTGRNFLVEVQGRDLLHLASSFEPTAEPMLPLPHPAGMLCQVATVTDKARPLLQGKDHEGVQRLGVAMPVKDTPWLIIASVSSASGFADLREKMTHQLIAFLLLLMLIAGGTGALWRLRHERSRAKELETRQAKDALAKRVGVLMQRVNDSILLFDQDMRIIEANDRAVRMYGYSLDELIGMDIHELRMGETKAAADLDFHAARSGQGVIFSTTHRRKDGTVLPVEVSACPVELEGRQLVISTVRDNTERQAQLREIEDLNRFFLVISRINQAILRQKTRRDLLATICNILVETGQFKIAWVGLFDPGTRLLSPIAVSGDEYGYVRAIHVSTDPSVPEGLGPSGQALREQQPVVCNDFMDGAGTSPWREEATRSGIRSSIAIPLRQEGRIVGMLNVYAREVNFFDPQKVRLLEKAANDVSFAMDLLASNERRHLTEAALVASERRLSFLLSATPAVIYSLKAGGSFATTFISSNVQSLLGYPVENFTQNPAFWSDHVHPDDLKQAMESSSSARPGEPIVRTYRFLHQDGAYRWMRDEMRCVLNDYGAPTEFVGYWADITESMRSAEELRVLHVVAQALDAPDKGVDEIISLIAENLPRAMRRPEATRVTVTVDGRSHSAGTLKASSEKYRTPIFINGREAGFIAVQQEANASGSQSPLISPELDTVESVAKSLGIGMGARESLDGIRKFNAELEKKVQERTAELALKNREIQGLLNAIPDLVMRIRADGCIIDIQQAHDSSALLALAAAKGSRTEMSADNPLIPVCLEAGREALRDERTVTREKLFPLPTGSVAVEFRAAPIDAEEFVVFVRDITTRKQIEQEMEEMLDKERQVSELRSRFISVTSHEFRTPMAATMGAVDILRNHSDKLSPAKREELYARVNGALHRMTSMLDDILTLSRLGASRIQVQITKLDIVEVVRGIVDEVRLGDQDAHTWKLRILGENPACESDLHLLHSILTNLLSNACRYSPQGTMITVELGLEAERLVLAVEDQGIGVPEKDWPRIFDPFERGSNVGTIKGTGLGLNIVKGMTELLGGEVRIGKSSTAGSRFIVSLPRHAVAPMAEAGPAAQA
jgi:PAS domain S-box-containing protein